jgi:hypothetical protein
LTSAGTSGAAHRGLSPVQAAESFEQVDRGLGDHRPRAEDRRRAHLV